MHIIVQSTSVLLCLLVIAGDRSFVDSAPVGESQEQEHVLETKESDDVRQLESLKHSLGKTLAMMKSQSAVYTDINGQREAHADSRTEVDADGKLMARVSQHLDSNGPDGGSAGDSTPSSRVRTDIDVPSRGIHKSIVQENVPGGGIGARILPNGPQTQQSAGEITDNGNRRGDIMMPDVTRDINNNLEKYTAYTSGVQYSPLDMAEYVFWTGDEKGVTLAIEEFLQDGLMTREEAIAFLQEIKFNLDYLQAHYSQQGLRSVDMQKEEQIAKERANRIQQNGVRFPSAGLRFRDPRTEFGQQKTFDISDLRKGMEKKSGLEQLKQNQRKEESSISDEEYEGLLERLRVADFLYTEYSLEEVIYQLAKVMFSQSLTRGSAEAQDALQKFTTFLESETEQGHISRSLEKKVLDVLIAALTDTLTEHPELVPAAREGLGGGTAPRLPPENHLLQQILDLTPEEKEAAQASLYAAFKGHNGHQIRQDNSHTGRDKSLPLSAPKYKTA